MTTPAYPQRTGAPHYLSSLGPPPQAPYPLTPNPDRTCDKPGGGHTWELTHAGLCCLHCGGAYQAVRTMAHHHTEDAP